jgi:alkylated DNA repair dioxygenase AlkB
LQFDFFESAREPGRVAKVLEGFRYSPELIKPATERDLVARFSQLPFREFEFHGYLGKRRIVSFGWQYDYSQSTLQKADAIPDFLLDIRRVAASFAKLEPKALQQVLVTEYGPGAGIGWHRDKPVFGEVVGISLLSPCVLRFRRKVGATQQARGKASQQWERVNVATEPRSAYHLNGLARAEWEHSILRVDDLRYAITFRTLRKCSVS